MPDPRRILPSSAVRRLLLASPVGPLFVEYDPEGVRALHYWPQGHHPPAGTRVAAGRDDPLGWAVATQLREYLAGARRAFDLPLAAAATDFRRRVRSALREIPYGETRTYGEIADAVGCGSARAVGQANRHNPLPILVPCHRVVAAGGLGGYAGEAGDGASLDTKRWLLRLEGARGV
jgi:methylated-DNA-[protein]-cysteine S-methyltransferase